MLEKDTRKLQENYYQVMDSFDNKRPGRILILGIGNYLMGDEGVGVHAIHTLSKMDLPDYVDIIDGATGSFELIPILSAYDKVIMIDATMDEKPPGTINVLYPRFAADFPIALSSHDIGLKDLFDALEFKEEMPRLILITVTIKDILSMRIDLSEDVEKALPAVGKKAIELAEKIHAGKLLN
ncbi:MAG: hydrogenase maturation protease [Bacteroidales bacterium]|nr:hydrogenase maturation protease [Bacteroidales bacterium]